MLRFDASLHSPTRGRVRRVRCLAFAFGLVVGASQLPPRAAAAQTPAVTIKAEPPNGVEGDPFTFVAELESGAVDGLVYAWDFGDGSPPVTGPGRSEVDHAFASAGNFTVTLSVTDRGGAEAVDRLRVGVSAADPDFVGEIAGEVPRFPFRGVAGPSSALNGLSALGLLGGDSMLGGVVDLSGPFGLCLVNVGFWDDRSQAHISVLVTLPTDAALEPRVYTGKWGDAEEGLAPGQVLVSALVLWSDPTYAEARELATNPPESGGTEAFMEMVRQGLAGELDEEPMGPGRNWRLTSKAGAVEVTRITSEVIEGSVQAYLGGNWQETDASGPVAYVQVEGDFTWPIEGTDRQSLLTCTGQR